MGSGDEVKLRLYNTLTRTKEGFVPLDPANVRMYVCGPTVYDYAHIGNARPAIVFDVLFRLLRHVYGAAHVKYVRNITDVDDKINARAARDYPDLPLNEAIRKVTEATNAQYQADVKALGCLEPSAQPRATEFIDEMIALTRMLLAKGHAYEAEGHVLFDVKSFKSDGELEYGKLARRSLDDMIAGARVEVAPYKRDPMDFVLWKPSSPEEPGWESPWGRGRPGWHLECSAMSEKHLGPVFDIHGGGIDLAFPHHENELAQSRCAHGTKIMAQVWMHNGFLQVEGQKMSKSLGNFVTIHELLATEKFGGRKWPGEVLRLAMLMTHYREPIDFSVARLEEAEQALEDWSIAIVDSLGDGVGEVKAPAIPSQELVRSLENDVSSADAMSALRALSNRAKDDRASAFQLLLDGEFLGVLNRRTVGLHSREFGGSEITPEKMLEAYPHYQQYRVERLNGDQYVFVQFIEKMKLLGLGVHELSHGELRFFELSRADSRIDRLISTRLAALTSKDFGTADSIRAELLEQGIQLMDYKDPETGERRTKWEVKR